jgi:hypothetical protein
VTIATAAHQSAQLSYAVSCAYAYAAVAAVFLPALRTMQLDLNTTGVPIIAIIALLSWGQPAW